MVHMPQVLFICTTNINKVYGPSEIQHGKPFIKIVMFSVALYGPVCPSA